RHGEIRDDVGRKDRHPRRPLALDQRRGGAGAGGPLARGERCHPGGGTDDPALTARDERGQPLARQPLRVIFDSRARTPSAARAVAPEAPGRALVVTTDEAPPEQIARLRAQGVEVLQVPSRAGRVDPGAALRELGRREVTSVFAEAGGELLASLLAAGLVDKVVAFIAPILVGGACAPTPLAGAGVETMDQAIRLRDVSYELVGRDVLVVGYPVCSPAS